MNQDKELEEIKAKKLKELQKQAQAVYVSPEDAAELNQMQNRCTNCKGTCEPELLTELKPGSIFCPTCVIKAATAFAVSKSFMIELARNKKKVFARVREFNADTNQFGEQKIIDMDSMPIISVVGNIEFYKVQPGRGQKK